MDGHTRRAVAYIAGRLVRGSAAAAVYDYAEERHVNFTGEVSAQHVNVYDYEQRCNVSGAPSSLYHYGNRRYIELNVAGMQFSGHDGASGRHFNGNVRGNGVTVYDYEQEQYFDYSV
jgi:hypothetical protein